MIDNCIFKDKEIGSIHSKVKDGEVLSYTVNLRSEEDIFYLPKATPIHIMVSAIMEENASKESMRQRTREYSRKIHDGRLRFTNKKTLVWGRQKDGTEITFASNVDVKDDNQKIMDALLMEFPIFQEEYSKELYPKIRDLKNEVKVFLHDTFGVNVKISKSKKEAQHQTHLLLSSEIPQLKKENLELTSEVNTLKNKNKELTKEKKNLEKSNKDLREQVTLLNSEMVYYGQSPRDKTIKNLRCQRCGANFNLRTNWKGDVNRKGEIFYGCENYTYNGKSCKNALSIDYDVYWEHREEIEQYLKEDLVVYWDPNKKEKDKRVLYETDCLHEVIEKKLPYPDSYYGR